MVLLFFVMEVDEFDGDGFVLGGSGGGRMAGCFGAGEYVDSGAGYLLL